MSFISRVIAPDERLIGVYSAHWIYGVKGLLWLFGATAVAFVFKMSLLDFASRHVVLSALPAFSIIGDYTIWTCMALGGLLFLFYLIVMISTEVALTTKRVIFKRGLIHVDVREVDIEEIKEANVDNGLLGRFFGYGYIILDARFVENIVLPAIGWPYRFVKALNLERARLRVNSFEEILNENQAASTKDKTATGLSHRRSMRQIKPLVYSKQGLRQKVKDSFHMIAHYGNKY